MDDPTSKTPQPPIRVLVVDDDVDTLVVMGKFLSILGIDAVPATSCADAWAAAQRERFRVVISDRHLRDGDGLALLWGLRQQYDCRTIVISGDPQPARGLRESFDLWLSKPTDGTRLRSAVAELLTLSA
jgi:CheY-like chemotaxis protein